MEIQFVFPVGMFGASESDDALDAMLRRIAVAASPDSKGEWAEKYGTDVSNDVFQMHRFCWCENEDCPWCGGCFCPSNTWCDNPTDALENDKCRWCRNEHRHAEYGALPPDQPPYNTAPHFWHKPSGFRVWWYKYIGRGVKLHAEGPVDLARIEAECMQAISRRAT